MQAIIAGLIRHALTTFGGGALATGVVTGSEVDAIAGAVTVLIGVAWSIVEKRLVAPK